MTRADNGIRVGDCSGYQISPLLHGSCEGLVQWRGVLDAGPALNDVDRFILDLGWLIAMHGIGHG